MSFYFAFFSIREKYIQVANEMVEHCFQPDFLTLEDYTLSNINKKYTLPFQKNIKKGVLNKTYIEKARKAVESSLNYTIATVIFMLLLLLTLILL